MGSGQEYLPYMGTHVFLCRMAVESLQCQVHGEGQTQRMCACIKKLMGSSHCCSDAWYNVAYSSLHHQEPSPAVQRVIKYQKTVS